MEMYFCMMTIMCKSVEQMTDKLQQSEGKTKLEFQQEFCKLFRMK